MFANSSWFSNAVNVGMSDGPELAETAAPNFYGLGDGEYLYHTLITACVLGIDKKM